jgi:hypothetical protein
LSGTGGSFTIGDGSEEISAFAVTPVPLFESFELALNSENIEPGTPLVLISGHKDSYASQGKQQKSNLRCSKDVDYLGALPLDATPPLPTCVELGRVEATT